MTTSVEQAAEPIERPPARWRIPYLLFGVRVPAQFLPWVERDIASSSWPLRFLAGRLLIVVPIYSATYLFVGRVLGWRSAAPALWASVLGWAIGSLGVLLVSLRTDFLRRSQRRYQRLGWRGTPTWVIAICAVLWVLAIALVAVVLLTKPPGDVPVSIPPVPPDAVAQGSASEVLNIAWTIYVSEGTVDALDPETIGDQFHGRIDVTAGDSDSAREVSFLVAGPDMIRSAALSRTGRCFGVQYRFKEQGFERREADLVAGAGGCSAEAFDAEDFAAD